MIFEIRALSVMYVKVILFFIILVSLLRKGVSHNQQHVPSTWVRLHALLPQAETSGHCTCCSGRPVSVKVTPRPLPYLQWHLPAKAICKGPLFPFEGVFFVFVLLSLAFFFISFTSHYCCSQSVQHFRFWNIVYSVIIFSNPASLSSISHPPISRVYVKTEQDFVSSAPFASA